MADEVQLTAISPPHTQDDLAYLANLRSEAMAYFMLKQLDSHTNWSVDKSGHTVTVKHGDFTFKSNLDLMPTVQVLVLRLMDADFVAKG